MGIYFILFWYMCQQCNEYVFYFYDTVLLSIPTIVDIDCAIFIEQKMWSKSAGKIN